MKYGTYLIALISLLLFVECNTTNNKQHKRKIQEEERKSELKRKPNYSVTIDQNGLYGTYKGLEFVDTGDVMYNDVAHQFSNFVADTLGKFLKASYKASNYYSIDFKKTKITTKGMDMKDTVVYCINMIFKKTDKCGASTGIEHCGSWGGQADDLLKKRLDETITNLAPLCIGRPKTYKYVTDEKFKEYWIQFKHKNYQGDCAK
jgi:hypothetical protein